MLGEVESGEHWNSAWGERPEVLEVAMAVARWELTEAPRLVPVYGHRFLPAGRGSSGHPVLSVWGTDIITYGADLTDYLDQEFEKPRPDRRASRATVPFWRDYL
ncbi:hypothetical protein GCM10011609_18100 [Lentzea pudingi]|uniref:SUKH-3 immunity protein n=1 Tax=Lentzea pudingi TaxID=1789439 RepID=A0ABQ2HI41_9PSEU|nr:hypothetical protein [Lentzea pudingi]GGM82523.1 hypothetical protein GCM10011609_18100 [Lentzea pudingi]